MPFMIPESHSKPRTISATYNGVNLFFYNFGAMPGLIAVETLDVVRAEENFCEVAVRQRSDQPIKDGQASALWPNWPEACSENACHRSIDGVTTQSEEDPSIFRPAWSGFEYVLESLKSTGCQLGRHCSCLEKASPEATAFPRNAMKLGEPQFDCADASTCDGNPRDRIRHAVTERS